MALGIFIGHRDGYDDIKADDGAFMYCTVSGWAFGPHFDSADDCKEFLAWAEKEGTEEAPMPDLRKLGTRELYDLHNRWLVATRRVA